MIRTGFEELWLSVLKEMGFSPRRLEKVSYTDEKGFLVEEYPKETRVLDKDGKSKLSYS
ncbi:hypothetical protein SAMN06265353_1389 [Hydrogenobacter hydrogenophilus]|uniref:Uncharacterized protein n=2 Tax=Hydrogenobacter hydrogenophilus TaxID=35835 RepID=A0A285P1A5_9AQUI|nr:hypothetical protein SAMN06265353_1389 [Hydrogenobacter hydrogenophilus]